MPASAARSVRPESPLSTGPVDKSLPTSERLIVALDVPDTGTARRVIDKLGDTVGFYKIGLQLTFAGGLDLAKELVAENKKVFLDSKVHDIDETVRGAVANVVNLGVHFLTVHGSRESIEAAVIGRGSSQLKIFSVTILTSLDADDLRDLGYDLPVEELVLHRARVALNAGADGVIASGLEAPSIRELAGDRLLIVTPGIRSKGVAHNEQRRVVTPSEAIRAGADYLVVGRQILTSASPRDEAKRVLDEMNSAVP